MATLEEENAWAAFLQSLAVALANFFAQVPPQDRTMENFQRVLDGYVDAILQDPTANSQAVREGVQRLQAILHGEIARVPLHRDPKAPPRGTSH